VIKPFCTTVIPTIGRASLARAVESVLAQALPDAAFEIVVVNDSGRPLPPADWQRAPCVRLLHTRCRERSVARNTGAALAHGRYLHFLDDDDWLLPGALARFWQAAQSQTADWLFSGFRFVDGDGRLLEENPVDESGNILVRLLAGEWLPLQASLIRSDAYWAVGGFDPALTMFEDNDLARQIGLRGEMQAIPGLAAAITRDESATTSDYSLLQTAHHQSREKLLNQAGTFTRLRASAAARPARPAYWQGRITSAYVNSALGNGRQGRWLRAAGRLLSGLGNVPLAGRGALTADFWRGALRPHQTQGFFRQDGVA
jgi:GT2 family glycosyltransferase